MNLSDRLEKCYTGAVYDVLRSMGHANCVLPATIRPLDPTKKLAGSVYTVSGLRDTSLDAHQTLLAWTELLSKAPRGSVIICQPNDSTGLVFRGVRGYIVDGGCRDSDFIERIGFPVFCRYFTPVDVVGRWIADDFGQPITVGSLNISTGDHVLADRDGIVIIPQSLVESAVTKTEQVMQTENLVRKAILQGINPREAYLQFGKF